MSGVRLGIDFDNTIIDYDHVFYALARSKGWLPESAGNSKNSVKQYLIDQDQNDHRWQSLQALAYGPEISQALFHRYCEEAIAWALAQGWEVHIVSHKTETSNWDKNVRLREHALAWMQKNKLLKQGDEGLIEKAQIHFSSSIEEKIETIKRLKLDLFVDDLLKVLKHPMFPETTIGIWFNPEQEKTKLLQASSWQHVLDLFKCIRDLGCMQLLHVNAILGHAPVELKLLKREGNNRIFIWQDQQEQYALKSYFHNDQDNRKRGEIEYRALKVLWEGQVRVVPRPYFFNQDLGLGLYGFIAGINGKSAQLPDDTVAQLVAFLWRLDNLYLQDKFTYSAFASHGRPSLQSYIDDISERYDLIAKGVAESQFLPRQLLSNIEKFLAQRLRPLKDLLFKLFIEHTQNYKFQLDAKFGKEQLTFSPSDFGMHNTLWHNGQVYFIDFEYAGLDDAAKLLADFYHHAGHELSAELKQEFVIKYIASRPHDPTLEARFKSVDDLVALEWILIVLNVFSPGAIERRLFANPDLNVESLVEMRLQKALKMIETMHAKHAHNPAFLSLMESP